MQVITIFIDFVHYYVFTSHLHQSYFTLDGDKKLKNYMYFSMYSNLI